ncbi:MAG: PAS domain-containing protein, partial [Bacteroidota bacterium]|nr:PAS domain-containing protein [Bacteroidota bacterium]
MPIDSTIPLTQSFLSGGGKMGEVIRTMDWSKTSVGNPSGWPQSLRTSVSICLNSQFPLLIWWGNDLVKIYNDAYCDLIATKHPKAMGANGADVWPEILPNVLPMLKGILKNGESTGSEDQLLVIERHGRLEVCYFTFSYSAIRDEAGNIGGIFCAVNETTKKVLAEKKLVTLLGDLLMQAPVALCIFRGENHVVDVANEMMLEFWGRTQNEVLNKPALEAFPEVKEQGFKELLDTVYKKGERFVAEELPVNLVRRGNMENAFVKFIYEPLREEDGTISGIMAVAHDITEQVVARKKAEESEHRYRNMIHTSTSMILILKGEDLVVEVANDAMLQTLGKGKDIFGKPLLIVIPEIIEQGLGKLLHQVYLTGEPNYGYELPVYIMRNGVKELSYYTFVYQPQRNVNGDIDGVAVIANEVTPQAIFNLKIKENEARFRSLVQQAPVAMIILKGNDYNVEIANDTYLQIVEKGKDFIGKPLFESMPDFKTQGIKELLDNVMDSGNPFYGNESEYYIVRNNKKEQCFFNFVYHPVRENQDKVTGIIVVANEITAQVLARKNVEESEQRFRNLVEKAPTPICILKGEDMVLQVANEPLYRVWNADKKSLGKPFLEIIPEMKGQPFMGWLLNVFHNGTTHYGNEEPVYFIRENGEKEIIYFNFVYQPYRENDGTISGVMVIATDVTEQVNAREKIQESNQRYHRMLMESPFAFSVMKGKDMVITLANDLIKDFWGKGDDVEGKALLELLPELADQPFPGILDDVYTTGVPFFANEILARLNRYGKMGDHYFNVVYQPHYEIDETISGVITVAYEVTEMVVGRNKLESQANMVRQLLMTAPGFVCTLSGPDHVYELVNEQYQGLFGKRQLQGKPLMVALPELEGQGFDTLLDKVYNTGEPYLGIDIPMTLARDENAEPELCYFNFSYQPMYDENRKIYSILVFGYEVTEQMIAKKRIEESELHFRQMTDLMPAKITNAEADGSVIYCNKNWLEFTGMSFENFKNFGYHNIIHPDELEEFQKRFSTAAERGIDLEMEMRFLNKEGEYIWNLNRASPVRDENGNIKMWIGVTT